MSQNSERTFEDQRARPFNPNEHLRKIRSREGDQDYLEVKWRLVWFREKYPHGTVDTEELEFDLDREVEAEAFVWNPETRRSEKVMKKARGYARYRAVVEDGMGGRGTGTKSEDAAHFPDFGEKAETGATGRALAALGFGTQFAPELNEEHRIVDAPVDRTPTEAKSPQNGNTQPTQSRPTNGAPSTLKPSPAPAQSQDAPTLATEQQLHSIRKLCESLGKAPTSLANCTYEAARELIRQYSEEYKASRKAS